MHGLHRSCLASMLLLSGACWLPARAVESLTLNLGEMAGDGWRAPGAAATLELTAQGPALSVNVPALFAAGREQPLLLDASLRCREVSINDAYLVCRDGRASFNAPPANTPVEAAVALVYRRADGSWRASGELELGGGSLNWHATSLGGDLSLDAASESLPVSALTPWLPRLPGALASLSGNLDHLKASATLPARGEVNVQASLDGSGLGFDTSDGTVAAAGVGLALTASLVGADGKWRATVNGKLRQGEFLAGSLYTKLGGEPMAFSGEVTVGDGTIRVDALQLSDPDSVSLSGAGRWEFGAQPPLRDLDLDLTSVVFPGFYTDFLQPVLAQYGFGGLAVAGTMQGALHWRDGAATAATASLQHVDISDGKGRLEATDLDGTLRWQAEGEPQASHLSWTQGRIYRIPVGPLDLDAEAVGDSLRFTRPVRLPVLDGTLTINALALTDWLSEGGALLFDATVSPVSLAQLSQVLEWPPLDGTLSGRIPELTYTNGVYRLGGSLSVQAFDGSLQVRNLRLERPFGVLPKLVADVELDNLDLERLTSTFSFGKIEGRLGGRMDSLRLLDWQPVHFDAEFGTPGDDHSRHRISQRAVDTLTSLGGGASGALSRSFLRVFDEFGYKRLGISCVLDNNVAHMGGVAPAPNGGYYLVEGSGLPRVDVIGHVRLVDWPRLISQLVEATRAGGPSVGKPPDGSP